MVQIHDKKVFMQANSHMHWHTNDFPTITFAAWCFVPFLLQYSQLGELAKLGVGA